MNDPKNRELRVHPTCKALPPDRFQWRDGAATSTRDEWVNCTYAENCTILANSQEAGRHLIDINVEVVIED